MPLPPNAATATTKAYMLLSQPMPSHQQRADRPREKLDERRQIEPQKDRARQPGAPPSLLPRGWAAVLLFLAVVTLLAGYAIGLRARAPEPEPEPGHTVPAQSESR
jgi:hypothetical protein